MSNLRSTSARLIGSIYGIYAWIAFTACVLFALIFAALIPGLARRRRWISAAARTSFIAAGVPVNVVGRENLHTTDCIVVANHASYLDGVLLFAFLPPQFSYVIKGEMQKYPIVNFLLRRIDAKFVERFNTSASARDARQLFNAARAGESLVFFPEGTFVKQAGLQRFRAGAYVAAIKARLPVVPVVISGSRWILPAGKILPRRGEISISMLAAITPVHAAFGSSKKLADYSRQRILSVLDEPDALREE